MIYTHNHWQGRAVQNRMTTIGHDGLITELGLLSCRMAEETYRKVDTTENETPPAEKL